MQPGTRDSSSQAVMKGTTLSRFPPWTVASVPFKPFYDSRPTRQEPYRVGTTCNYPLGCPQTKPNAMVAPRIPSYIHPSLLHPKSTILHHKHPILLVDVETSCYIRRQSAITWTLLHLVDATSPFNYKKAGISISTSNHLLGGWR